MAAVLSGVGTAEEVPPGTGGAGPGLVVLVVNGGVELIVGRLDGRRPHLALVDALARCQLSARRSGCAIRLRDPCPALGALLELVGLADVVGAGPSGTSAGRLDAAHGRVLEIVRSLTGDELQDPRCRRYLGNPAAHYDEHREELAALLR